MEIDEKLIAYLENLSCLELTQDEREKLMPELRKILDSMAKLSELGDVEIQESGCVNISCGGNVFREDVVLQSFPRESILKNAFASDDEMFIAPKVME